MKTKEIRFLVDKAGPVSGLLTRPDHARCLLLLAHGAGAGMRHRFMEEIAKKLGALSIATLRYQFPYMEKGAKRPDPEAVLVAAVRAATGVAAEQARDLPLFAGGKSMGGRMTSIAAAQAPLDRVRGLIYFGFPLHAAGKPAATRGGHLRQISVPMLFLQGTRDMLAHTGLIEPLCRSLGRRAELFLIPGADHSFHVLKSSGQTDDQVLDDVAREVSSWTTQMAGKSL